MVAWWWLPVAFIAGGVVGAYALGLFILGGGDDG